MNNLTINISNIFNGISSTNTFFSSLSQIGFFNTILPFLLIFSLIYMIVELSGLLRTGDDDIVGRRLSALFSFSFALLSMANQNLINWLNTFIPNATIAILGFFLLAIILSITGKKIPGFVRAILGFIVVGIILWLALNALQVSGNSDSISNSLLYIVDVLLQSGLLSILIIFLILIIVVAWATGGKGGSTSRGSENQPSIIIRQ